MGGKGRRPTRPTDVHGDWIPLGHPGCWWRKARWRQAATPRITNPWRRMAASPLQVAAMWRKKQPMPRWAHNAHKTHLQARTAPKACQKDAELAPRTKQQCGGLPARTASGAHGAEHLWIQSCIHRLLSSSDAQSRRGARSTRQEREARLGVRRTCPDACAPNRRRPPPLGSRERHIDRRVRAGLRPSSRGAQWPPADNHSSAATT